MTHGTWRRPLQALIVAAFAMGVGGASGSRALAQARATPSPVQAVPVPHEVHARIPPLKAPKSALVEFDVSPFPYEGHRAAHQSALLRRHGRRWPARPQLGTRGRAVGGRHLQRSPGAAVHAEGLRRAPAGRDRGLPARQPGDAGARRRRPPAGRGADRGGQRQRGAGGAAAGRQRQRFERRALLESYGFARFIGEAGAHLAQLHGDKRTRKTFATLPVVIVAYSGGYVPAAWALHKGGSDARVIGVLLLDALYGEVDKYADFIARHPNAFFVSAYTSSSARGNEPCSSICPSATSPSTPACRRACKGACVPAHVRRRSRGLRDARMGRRPDPRGAGADGGDARDPAARPEPARRRAVSRPSPLSICRVCVCAAKR